MNMGAGQAKQCQLRTFLTYYINDLFLNQVGDTIEQTFPSVKTTPPIKLIKSFVTQVRTEINKEIEAVSKVADPLKILASADAMKVLGVQRPVLQVRYQKSS